MGLEELRLWPPGPQYPESLNPKARMPRTLLYCTRHAGARKCIVQGLCMALCFSSLFRRNARVLLIQIALSSLHCCTRNPNCIRRAYICIDPSCEDDAFVHTGSSCIAASGDVEKENEHGNADGSTISRHGTVAGVRLR